MPCKTVVFGIDSPKLTPLQFRQMSCRAGRRGFDTAGTVVFMGVPTSKIRHLLTASLQTLRGNALYTTSFMLRLFNYVVGWKNTAAPVIKDLSLNDKAMKKKAPLDTNDLLSPEIRLRAAKTLLENSFVLQTSGKCELTGFAIVAAHLSKFEPGNLLFVEFLQRGAFHRLSEKYGETQKAELKRILMNILAHLFTNKPLSIYGNYDARSHAKQHVLEPMPEEFENIRTEYNKTVDDLLMAFLELSTEDANLLEGLILDHALIPSLATKQVDHRGNKTYRNSYAYEFYQSGSRKRLTDFNKLATNRIWYKINDFDKALIAIKESLAAVGKDTDPVVEMFTELSGEFHQKFESAFAMHK
ncbi:DEAD box protein/DEAH protein box helicase [Aphelenchoides avenae]|nr:DEAD box protein/DEAH protein box helicase [Aphelenchus avenae]